MPFPSVCTQSPWTEGFYPIEMARERKHEGAGSFYQRIYALVRQIPEGRIATYGQLALLAGAPHAARAVGYALSACRDPGVPCHRVVDRFGGTKAAFDLFAPGIQRTLLEAEGVAFLPDGNADLSRFRWNPERGQV